MKFNFKHPIINRIRKPNSSIYNVLRLNRAEYGHSYKLSKKKKIQIIMGITQISQHLCMI